MRNTLCSRTLWVRNRSRDREQLSKFHVICSLSGKAWRLGAGMIWRHLPGGSDRGQEHLQWPLHVSWASSPRGGWVPRWNFSREQGGRVWYVHDLSLASPVASLPCTCWSSPSQRFLPGFKERGRMPHHSGGVSMWLPEMSIWHEKHCSSHLWKNLFWCDTVLLMNSQGSIEIHKSAY